MSFTLNLLHLSSFDSQVILKNIYHPRYIMHPSVDLKIYLYPPYLRGFWGCSLNEESSWKQQTIQRWRNNLDTNIGHHSTLGCDLERPPQTCVAWRSTHFPGITHYYPSGWADLRLNPPHDQPFFDGHLLMKSHTWQQLTEKKRC